MARFNNDRLDRDHRFRPDLLNRLKTRDRNAWISQDELKNEVRDSLVNLFNSTNMGAELDPAVHPEAARSVINYGIAPVFGNYLTTLNWSKLETMLRQAIEAFEPRIIPESLAIEPAPGPEKDGPGGGRLSFSLRATIRCASQTMELVLESDYDRETQKFKLSQK